MEHNLAAMSEAIAAARPDRECIVFRDRRLTWADVTDRTRRLANVLLAQGSAARPHEGRERSCRAGSPARTTSRSTSQRQRVPRGHARRLQGARRAVQRELPLRRGGARATCSRDAGARAIVYHGAFAPTLAAVLADLPELAGAAAGRRRQRRRAAARRGRVRGGARARQRRATGRRVVARRPLHPLHGRHDRHAEGRAVAPGRHLLRRRWAATATGVEWETLDDRRPPERRRHALPAGAAVHARRRPLDRVDSRCTAAHGRDPGRSGDRSTPTTSGGPSSARGSPSC